MPPSVQAVNQPRSGTNTRNVLFFFCLLRSLRAVTSMRRFDLSRYVTPSTLVLVGANLLPLYGVLFLRWEVFPLIFLFWTENLIIGASNILRMLLAVPDSLPSWLGKLFLIPFFTVHYGMFTMVHGLFVILLFGGQHVEGMDFPTVDLVLDNIERAGLGLPILALGGSHTFSFFFNYIGKGEYRRAELPQLMWAPYSRVVILHITLIFGGMLLMALKSPLPGLLLLILLKIGVDVRAHLSERARLSRRNLPSSAPATT